ncbi:hypothetical protein [Egicoccus halophilus]|uniref:Uncharacterized protein n=1 Tax=Egicoccus halophilus TaxID=1670830 RepID=A0A8J3AEB0_9ACTN|nr:hypothetical protein [Egicoccus halophilus]GGI05496.1 hypothetical protein GCM10011354_14390 [Egicoccus halophilus]
MDDRPIDVRIRPRLVLGVVLSLAAVFVASTFVVQLLEWRSPSRTGSLALKLVHVGSEQSLATLFATTLLLGAGALLAVIAWRKQVDRRRDRWYWTLLAVAFLALAIDEFGSWHELLVDPVRDRLEISGGLLYFAWVVPAIVAVALFALAFVPFLRRLPARTRWGFLLAGGVFVGGAVGVEMLGGAYATTHGYDSVGYLVLTCVEEGLEMVGAGLFIATLLAHLPRAGLGRWSLQVTDPAADSPSAGPASGRAVGRSGDRAAGSAERDAVR